MTVICGEIEEIIYRNDVNGFTVCSMKSNDKITTVTGCLFNISIGETIKVSGNWTNHPSYGEQFKADYYEREEPKTEESVQKFLGSGVIKGVGEATAKKIIKRFGNKALDIIKDQPEKLSEIKGISSEKASSIGQAFKEYGEMWDTTLFLQKYGISPTYANKIYKQFGDGAVKLIKENPYKLSDEMPGIGFRTADKIAMAIGFDPLALERAASCLIDILLRAALEGGNTYLPYEIITGTLSRIIGAGQSTVERAVFSLEEKGKIKIESQEEKKLIFLNALYHAEKNVAHKLISLSETYFEESEGFIDKYILLSEKEQGIQLAENQKKAVKEALLSGLMIITGGPGTGKTTIIKTMVSILEKMGLSYCLSAPTGRAAQRLSEAAGKEAKTIHRMLEIGKIEDEKEELLKINKNVSVILEDVVIIDEISMVDIILMNKILEALPRGTRLIMVGDADQLPAVGPGNVLKDIISSEVVKVVKLDEIFRQERESMIIVNAHKINKGIYPEIKRDAEDFFLIRTKAEQDTINQILSLCTGRLHKHRGYDWFNDIQVLSPTKKGMIGVKNLNVQLQNVLNPYIKGKAERNFSDYIFREGDKVMQVKNNYEIIWRRADASGEYGFGLFNGDIGLITEIDNAEGIIRVVYDDKIVDYTADLLNEIELAYAITVHKSQGSEFKAVIMPVFSGMPLLTNRNLLYTAVTRAKEMVVLIGKDEDVKSMIDNHHNAGRYSNLSNKIITCNSTEEPINF